MRDLSPLSFIVLIIAASIPFAISDASPTSHCQVNAQTLSANIKELTAETDIETRATKLKQTVDLCFELYKNCQKQDPQCLIDLQALFYELHHAAEQFLDGFQGNFLKEVRNRMEVAGTSCNLDLTYWVKQIDDYPGAKFSIKAKEGKTTNCKARFDDASLDFDALIYDFQTRAHDLSKLTRGFSTLDHDLQILNSECDNFYN